MPPCSTPISPASRSTRSRRRSRARVRSLPEAFRNAYLLEKPFSLSGLKSLVVQLAQDTPAEVLRLRERS
jgi:hypothetical protein